MPTFAVEPLTDATAQILAAAGAPDDIAAKISRWLVNANLSGHPSHGVIRVSQYLDQIAGGSYRPAERPQLRSETDTTVLMEGGGAFGHPRVYLRLGEDRTSKCPYCGRHFVLKRETAS